MINALNTSKLIMRKFQLLQKLYIKDILSNSSNSEFLAAELEILSSKNLKVYL